MNPRLTVDVDLADSFSRGIQGMSVFRNLYVWTLGTGDIIGDTEVQ